MIEICGDDLQIYPYNSSNSREKTPNYTFLGVIDQILYYGVVKSVRECMV